MIEPDLNSHVSSMTTPPPMMDEKQSGISTSGPISEWSSLELDEIERYTLRSRKSRLSPGEHCAAYISLSDSDVPRHVYYNYPAVLDPGIKEAILSPDEPLKHEDNGQTLYLALCNEMNACPVRIFHRNLLNEEINLSYYCVDPRSVRAISMALYLNKHVRRLILTDNFLSDDACYHLGQMLIHNRTLEELNLSGCRIGLSGLKRLGESFYLNNTLKAFDLSRNNLRDEGGIYLAKMIVYGTSIIRFNLRKNGMGRGSAEALSNAFYAYYDITQLDLSWNEFYNAASTSTMLDSLAESSVLTEVNLSWNALEGERIAKAIKRLTILPTLQTLDLSNNRLQGTSIGIIVSNLRFAKTLKTLDLSYNPMLANDAYVALSAMANKKVKLKKLLMADVWVNKDFIPLLERVKRMKCRKKFTITYGGVYKNWTVSGPDPREVILRRADFLGRNKTKKADVPLYFMKLLKENSDLWNTKTLLTRCQDDGIPLSEDFIKDLSSVFPGGTSVKIQYVNMGSVVDYIHRMWPDKKLPTTPNPAEKPIVSEKQDQTGIRREEDVRSDNDLVRSGNRSID